ncbi:MAG TPA: glycosyltransferase [Solirubrobacteraceae bacterium]|nr:glycosyltransferase [Solirubrobacteraceae bacterium]
MCAAIDVVIPVHGAYELTADCLTHLAAQSAAHRTIVYDDASPDDSARRLAREWPAVEVMTGAENVGFARACNRGVAAGEAEIVVVLNNDVTCRPDFLERLVAPLLADSGAGSVTALLTRPDGERIDSVGLCADITLAGFPRLRGQPLARAQDREPVLLGPTGAAGAYRRAAWEQAGGLEEELHAYLEDFDLALRLRIAGWGALAAPEAVGVHLGSATYGHRSRHQRWSGGYSRGYLLRRYGSLKGRHAARTALTEATVVAGDLCFSHDLAALRGRLAGWRAARTTARLPHPPAEAIAKEIGLRESLALRRGIYAEGQT